MKTETQKKESKKYKCEQCCKWYTTQRALNAHQQEFCKLTLENKNNNMNDIINNLKKIINK